MDSQKQIVVLFVIKDVQYAGVAADCLRSQGGMEVDFALSVHDAFYKMEKRRPNAIICEMELPDMSGLEFLKMLRGNNDKTPFILFASNDENSNSDRAFQYGAEGFFVKSAHPEEGLTQIRKCIECWARDY